MKSLSTLACATAIAALAATSGHAATYNFDFSDEEGSPVSTFAGAGAAGLWNVTPENVAASTGFTDTTGTLGPVSVTIVANELSGNAAPSATDLGSLTEDNFYSTAGNTWSVTLSGLLDGTYTAFLYAPRNTAVVLGNGTIGGLTFASVTGDTDTLTPGVSYATVTGIDVTGGTLSISGSTAGTPQLFSGMAGLQLVPVPLPASLGLMLTALGGVALARRRRRG